MSKAAAGLVRRLAGEGLILAPRGVGLIVEPTGEGKVPVGLGNQGGRGAMAGLRG